MARVGRENKIKRARRAVRGFVDIVDDASSRKVGPRARSEPLSKIVQSSQK